MIPYKDENPTVILPLMTVGIIAVNVLAWLFLQGAGSRQALAASVCQLGMIPAELFQAVQPGTRVPLGPGIACVIDTPHYATVITSMFMHGGWLHIIGNMWFLWVFGNNIEDSMGHTRFAVFYLLCGVVAAGAQLLTDPHSRVPMVGASGAISGVLGAYILLFPRVRVHTLVTLGFFVTSIALPAYVMLGYWFVLQIVLGMVPHAAGGVAVWAHVGGFVAGVVLIRLFVSAELAARHQAL